KRNAFGFSDRLPSVTYCRLPPKSVKPSRCSELPSDRTQQSGVVTRNGIGRRDLHVDTRIVLVTVTLAARPIAAFDEQRGPQLALEPEVARLGTRSSVGLEAGPLPVDQEVGKDQPEADDEGNEDGAKRHACNPPRQRPLRCRSSRNTLAGD